MPLPVLAWFRQAHASDIAGGTGSGDPDVAVAALHRRGLAAGRRYPERPAWIQVGSGSRSYPADVLAILPDPPDGDASLERVTSQSALK